MTVSQLPWAWLILPVVATLLGGLLAVRFARHRAVLAALGAGLLLGAAFLDLLPESIALGTTAGWRPGSVLGLSLLCFLGFTVLESWIDTHRNDPTGQPGTRLAGRLAGAMLIFHSFRDGVAIGAAFTASHPVGYAVATGIVAHDLGDGMNTVLLTTRGERPDLSAYVFLALDALAPFAGGLLAVWWLVSPSHTVALLALAAGFFLQMATSDFMPQVRQSPHRRSLLAAVVAGAGFIYAANWLLLR